MAGTDKTDPVAILKAILGPHTCHVCLERLNSALHYELCKVGR